MTGGSKDFLFTKSVIRNSNQEQASTSTNDRIPVTGERTDSKMKSAPVFLATFLLVGCATLFQGLQQDVNISSKPEQVSFTVQIDGNPGLTGVTPQLVSLRKGKQVTITFKRQGYGDVEVPLTKKISGGFIFDILLLSPLGIVVDLSDGAAFKYQNELFVDLEQDQPVSGTGDKKEIRAVIRFMHAETGKVAKLSVSLKPAKAGT